MIKSGYEKNKPVWQLIRTNDNKIIDTFRSKALGLKEMKRLIKLTGNNYELKRNNQWRYSL